MDRIDFVNNLQNKRIKNGTKFEVFDNNDIKLGIVGVIDTTIVYLDMPNIPADLLVGDYRFIELDEENAE